MKLNAIFVLAVFGLLAIAGCQTAPAVENNNESYTIDLTTDTPVTTTTTETPVVKPVETTTVTEVKPTGVVVEGTEGDLIQLKPVAIDPDNDKVIYFFTSPFDTSGKWQTKDGDAGNYPVTVTASDGKLDTKEDITVVVKKGNKAPVVECPTDVTVNEGETISLNCNVYDPEGDNVVIEYSGFMKSATYKTTYSDAGHYTTLVTAKDKTKFTTKTIKVTIVDTNRAPEVTFNFNGDTIKATEEDVVTIAPRITDPDGDKVTVTYATPFNSNGVWSTKIGDAGTYTTSVVASDGKTTTKKEFKVVIEMKNTAPVMKKINDITVSEGDLIKLPIDVTDREGDKVDITVKGWMNSQTYQTTYDDAGVYSVTVIANDGKLESKQTFKVTVVDRNRPPVFRVVA